jgi:hypothetical protein
MKTKIFIISLLVLCGFNLTAQDLNQVQAKLETIADSSLLLRKDVMPILRKYGTNSHQLNSINKVIIKHDSVSLVEVQQVLDKYGWLGISQIGEKANQAIYLTIQHAQDKNIREKYFPLLKESAKKRESKLADMATMKDRILVENGKKQIYGTQYKIIEGERVLLPIKDSKNINKRREKVGLEKINPPLTKAIN